MDVFESCGDLELNPEAELTKEYDLSEEEVLEILAEGLTDVDTVLERDIRGLTDGDAERNPLLELNVDPDADFIPDGVRIFVCEFMGVIESTGVNDDDTEGESLSICEYVVSELYDTQGLIDSLAEDESDDSNECVFSEDIVLDIVRLLLNVDV